MKRFLSITLLVLLAASLIVLPAAAKPGKGNIKGVVTAVNPDGTLSVQIQGEGEVKVAVPASFDLEPVKVGDRVMIKGAVQEDGLIVADSIKTVGKGNEDDDGDGDEDPEVTVRSNSAFCTDGKQDRPHPVAVKLAERYGVSESWVMEKFCAGHSVGAIMLAVTMGADYEGGPDAMLAEKAGGKGWGQIWKGAGLIGAEKEADSPPGWLKRPPHAGPKKDN